MLLGGERAGEGDILPADRDGAFVWLIDPGRIFINVDLPAPFSPHTPWISPAARSKSTDASARTPGNCLPTPTALKTIGALLTLELVMRSLCVAPKPALSRLERGLIDVLLCVRRRIVVLLLRHGLTLCHLHRGFQGKVGGVVGLHQH